MTTVVLEAPAARWTSGGEPVRYEPVLEDPSLPHQIRLAFTGSKRIRVSCSGRDCSLEITGPRPEFPAAEALAAYRGWHSEQGVTV